MVQHDDMELGPKEYFSGAMGAAQTARQAKTIRILANATFTSLVDMYPAAPAATGAVNPNTLTFPAGTILRFIKSFQLATGTIIVTYIA